MGGKKNKKSSRKARKQAQARQQAPAATVIRGTASVHANAQPTRRPTQTRCEAPARAAAQGLGGRLLTVEVQATTEIRAKEFIRVAIRLSARFPVEGDRTVQGAALAGAARGVLDAEIAWTQAPKDQKPPKHAFAFPAGAWAREVGVTYGCTVRRVPRDPDCFEFVRAEVGCVEPLADGDDEDKAMDLIQDWVAVQIKEQVRIARGGSVAVAV